MTVQSSSVSRLLDAALVVTLRERGLSHTVTHYEPGCRVPRRGSAYWDERADYDWTLRVTYVTTGTEPHGLEIWAANGGGVPDVMVAGITLPAHGSGEAFARVDASLLKVIPLGEPLFLFAKLIVSEGGSVDVGATLERAA